MASNTRTIFRPDLESIKGKTVQRTPAPVVGDYVEVPRSVIQNNKIVAMAADMFFMDGSAFLITVSWRIKFITAEHMQQSMQASGASPPGLRKRWFCSKNNINGWRI